MICTDSVHHSNSPPRWQKPPPHNPQRMCTFFGFGFLCEITDRWQLKHAQHEQLNDNLCKRNFPEVIHDTERVTNAEKSANLKWSIEEREKEKYIRDIIVKWDKTSSRNWIQQKCSKSKTRERIWEIESLRWPNVGGKRQLNPKDDGIHRHRTKNWRIISLSLQYVISDSYGMAELNSTVSAVAADFNAFPTENFTARFSRRSAKRQKCLHSSTPEMYTNRHSVYTLCNPYMNPNVRIHIVLFYTHTWEPPPYDKLWRYIGFVRLCVCIQVESKRVSYFDCRNHMQIHRKNLFFFPLKMIIATAFLQLKMKFKHLLKLL